MPDYADVRQRRRMNADRPSADDCGSRQALRGGVVLGALTGPLPAVAPKGGRGDAGSTTVVEHGPHDHLLGSFDGREYRLSAVSTARAIGGRSVNKQGTTGQDQL